MNDNTISRREFGMAAGAAGVGVIASSKSVAAREPGGPPLNYASGLIESPPTYYEVLEPAGGSTKPPMILICGGGHTGACYLATVDGRPGWAQAFVRAGYKVVVPDWPGVGRSGYIPIDDLTGDVVVEGLGKIVRSLGQPAIVMTHSMSGAYGWKLIENYGQHLAKLVAIAPGPPGNIQAVSDIASETVDTVVVRGSTTMTINLKQPVVSDRNFVEVKLVGKSRGQARRQEYAVSARVYRGVCLLTHANPAAAALPAPQYSRQPAQGQRSVQLSRQAHPGDDWNRRHRSSARTGRGHRRVAQSERREGGFPLSRRPRNRRQRPHDDAREEQRCPRRPGPVLDRE